MNFLLNLLPIEIAYATNGTVSASFFTIATTGVNIFANIVKWAALLWVLVKLIMIGFKITTSAKNGADAITIVKEQLVALLIGLFIVLTSFSIHTAIKESAKGLGTSKTATSVEWQAEDNFNIK